MTDLVTQSHGTVIKLRGNCDNIRDDHCQNIDELCRLQKTYLDHRHRHEQQHVNWVEFLESLLRHNLVQIMCVGSCLFGQY